LLISPEEVEAVLLTWDVFQAFDLLPTSGWMIRRRWPMLAQTMF
jgi:hypothetical protein